MLATFNARCLHAESISGQPGALRAVLRISQGGLGAPLDRVLGKVLGERAKNGVVERVSLDELADAVRDSDWYGYAWLGAGYRTRTRVPSRPSTTGISKLLGRARAEGLIATTRVGGGLRIELRAPWPFEGWHDEHDPTECHCQIIGEPCLLHPDRGSGPSWDSYHAGCDASMPCRMRPR